MSSLITRLVKKYVASTSPCPIGRAARLMGDRWVLLILREMFVGVTRFDDFFARTGINRAALTSRLSKLVQSGLVERRPVSGRRAQYHLTEAGQALAPTFAALRDWGSEWLFADEERPSNFV